MATLTYTPTEAMLKSLSIETDSASGPSFIRKQYTKGSLAAAAVVIDLRSSVGIPLVTFDAGVTMYVSTDPELPFDSGSRNWTAVAAGDGFADCPAYVAFEGTGAYELYIQG